MADKQNWLSLADKFAEQGDLRGMRAAAKEVLAMDPEDLDGLSIKAEATFYMEEYEEARALTERILVRNPEHLRALLVQAGQAAVTFVLDEEIQQLRHLLALSKKLSAAERSGFVRRTLVKAQGWLADACCLLARPREAAEALFEASWLAEGAEKRAGFFSKGLFMTNYESQTAERMKHLYGEYQSFFADIVPYYPPAKTVTTGTRRQQQGHHMIRVGYISPDFRLHAAAFFFAPLLRGFDKKQFEVYCYSAGRHDRVTQRLKRSAVIWREIAGMKAAEAAKMIYKDQIDILVDLSGHTQNSCLPVVSYRPAPVQISGIGYTNTTGLLTVDYFLSDPYCLPPLEAVHGFTEEILRLPHTHLCYAPELIKDYPKPCDEPPCIKNGYVTFGCFNNFSKVSEETLTLWRGILDRMPEAKLVLKGKTFSVPSGCAEVKKRLMNFGIRWQQIETRPYSQGYLEQYGDIDIALDTTPYTGGLTTCEALYMGVPVITLRGRTHGARFSASILENAGLSELVADGEMNYVHKAVSLARSPELLAQLHEGLRKQLQSSRLMDGQSYIKEVEDVYQMIAKR